MLSRPVQHLKGRLREKQCMSFCCSTLHTVEKDVPKPDFSKKDKRTVSLVPELQKLGTKVQDNGFVKILIRDNQNSPYFCQGQAKLSLQLRKIWKTAIFSKKKYLDSNLCIEQRSWNRINVIF